MTRAADKVTALFVLDASVAASWYFFDEEDTRAEAVLARLADEGALAPLHWWFEIRNVIVTGMKRNRPTTYSPEDFLLRIEKSNIALAPLPDSTAVLALAIRHRLTFYDAAYLELAQRERFDLATFDDDLASAAITERVSLVVAPP